MNTQTVEKNLFFLLSGITWGKVVSLYAVAAGLAVDCVRHAQPAMVHTIVDCLGEFVRKTLVTWLKRRGGWVSGTGLHSTTYSMQSYREVISKNRSSYQQA